MLSFSRLFNKKGTLFLLFVFQTFPGIDFTPEENLSISGIPTKKEGKVRPYFAVENVAPASATNGHNSLPQPGYLLFILLTHPRTTKKNIA